MILSEWQTEEHEAMMTKGAVQTAPVISPELATLRIFPVKAKGKRPLMKGWQDVEPVNMAAINGWQEKHPECNWGVALDADTFVIDCDSDVALSALYDYGEAFGGIPLTLTTLTPRGCHFWFRTPIPMKNRVAVMAGVDVRTKGGFVVVPPSVGNDGTPYEFASMEVRIADAPEWLLSLVTGTAAVPSPGTTNDAHSSPPGTVLQVDEELTPFQKDVANREWEKRRAAAKVPDGRSPFSLLIALEPQNVIKGIRNAALFAYLCRLRSEGKPDASIRSEAFRVVARISEPMSKFEVERIIANAMKFDAGAVGKNTLVMAWRTVEQIEAGPSTTKWYRFLLLVEQLAEMRPETRSTILLPVRSIGTLMNVHFTQVAKWRQKAREMGILSLTSRYVRRNLADEFTVKAGFSPLADGAAKYKVKRGRKPKNPVKLQLAA